MYAINVTGTGNVLDLALELGIPRTVYISSVTNYGETGSEARATNCTSGKRLIKCGMSRPKPRPQNRPAIPAT